MKPGKKNSYNCLKSIDVDGKNYKYFSLKEAEKNGLNGISTNRIKLYRTDPGKTKQPSTTTACQLNLLVD